MCTQSLVSRAVWGRHTVSASELKLQQAMVTTVTQWCSSSIPLVRWQEVLHGWDGNENTVNVEPSKAMSMYNMTSECNFPWALRTETIIVKRSYTAYQLETSLPTVPVHAEISTFKSNCCTVEDQENLIPIRKYQNSMQ